MSDNATKYVIFDFGGTIVPLEHGINLFEEASKRIGRPFKTSPELLNKIIDLEVNKEAMIEIAGMIFEETDGKKDQQLIQQFMKNVGQVLNETKVNMSSGIDRLFDHLKANNIPMAIATNMAADEWQTYSGVVHSFDPSLFSHVHCGANEPEVVNNKPAPDIYLVCAKKFANPPKSMQECVIFEDSLTGIKGAIASGMKTVLINNRRGSHFDDISDKITSIANSFEEFKPESVGLPPYQ